MTREPLNLEADRAEVDVRLDAWEDYVFGQLRPDPPPPVDCPGMTGAVLMGAAIFVLGACLGFVAAVYMNGGQWW